MKASAVVLHMFGTAYDDPWQDHDQNMVLSTIAVPYTIVMIKWGLKTETNGDLHFHWGLGCGLPTENGCNTSMGTTMILLCWAKFPCHLPKGQYRGPLQIDCNCLTICG